MNVTEAENGGEIRLEAGFDNTNTFRVSVQYVDNQEGISEDTFKDDNTFIDHPVKCNAWRTREAYMGKLCMMRCHTPSISNLRLSQILMMKAL
ncbi:hypothetical protein ROHU_028625 [Labeo rohita]|uniref:Uncharacterized protein n=1 Tax=Labeo rohita TaxID=84645 RepID=A0A498M4F9_LABRO|nr:hypothetical protein ROHU_028625 [Labeo rohita]